MKNYFSYALKYTLENEGPETDDPHDPGGRTRFGISQANHPNIDVANLSQAQAEAIYRSQYWHAPGVDRLSDLAIAVKTFDLGVNLGTKTAVWLLQKSLNCLGAELKEDGIFGPKTLAAVNGYRHPAALLMALKIQAGLHYLESGKKRFIDGWLIRLDKAV